MSRFAHTFVNSISSAFVPSFTTPGGRNTSYGSHQTVPTSCPFRTTRAICPLQFPSERMSARPLCVNEVRYVAVPLKYRT